MAKLKADILQKKSHPYLFFTMDEVPALRKAATTTHKQYFEILKKWADVFVEFNPLQPARLPVNIDTMQVYCESGASYIFNMSLIYHLTGDSRYLNVAKKWLLVFSSYPSDIKGNFCIGAYAVAVASGYDMLYNELSPEERIQLSYHLAAIVRRGVLGTTTDWWAGISLNHDHWLPVSGLGVGAAALYYENRQAPGWLGYLLDITKTDMGIVGDDGAWTEGTADWIYGMYYTYVFFDVYKKLSDIDMFQLPMVKNASTYRLYNWLTDNTYIYHHDSFINGRYNVLGSVSSHLMHKLAHEHKDSHIQWLANQEEILDYSYLTKNIPVKSDWQISKSSLVPALHCVGWNFLWYDAKVKPVPPDDLPTNHYFPNQGLVILRTGWQKDDLVFAFTCSPVGGHNARAAVINGNRLMLSNYGHTHAQANSYDLYAYGNYLAVPPSYGRLESNNHNTLTIEGAIQQRKPQYEAKLLSTDLKNNYAYLLGDATECYPDSIGLKRWYRHVAFIPPDIFVIGDELRVSQISRTSRPTKWHLNYDPKSSYTIDSVNQIVNIDNNSTLQAKILYPSNVKYENKTLNYFAKQVSVVTDNIFGIDKQNQIVAVLTAMKKDNLNAPGSRLIKSENMIGAVVDRGNTCDAAVFCINTGSDQEFINRNFNLLSRKNTTCYIFSLATNTAYDVKIISKPNGDGLILYTIEIKKGRAYTANTEGTLILKL